MELPLSVMAVSAITHCAILLVPCFSFHCGGFSTDVSLNSRNLALIASSDELIKAVLNFCHHCLFYYLFCLGTGSNYIGQGDLKIVILLPQLLKTTGVHHA